jgi:sugar lactone lactonase YvrE
MRVPSAVAFALIASWTASSQTYTISTFAGGGSSLGDNGPATSAQLSSPLGVAVDAAGNLYIADTNNNRIRKVSGGVITTVAGNGTAGFSGDSGPATSIQLNAPSGVAVDTAGNLYIADTNNNRVRKVSDGIITTVAGNGTLGFSGDGGSATSAQLKEPWGVAVDTAGNLYIAEPYSYRVRKVSGGIITTVAGNGTPGISGDGGPATSAELNVPMCVVVDAAGSLYIADLRNNRVRRLTMTPVPFIYPNGIVPIYSSVPVIQAGSWVSIYGTDLANGTFLWNGSFPTSLALPSHF